MSEEDTEGSWLDFYEGNISVPPHPLRQFEGSDVETTSFCLTLNSFEYAFESEVATKFQHRITLFDTKNQHFFGGTWIGPILTSSIVSPGLHAASVNEVCYFHTINDYSTIAVVEVSCVNGNHWETVGWGWIRIFANFDSLTDTNEISRPQEKRLEFCHGSSMALQYISEPIAEFPQISKIDKCTLAYSLQTHETLMDVKHYIPENVIVSGDDIIPGIYEIDEEVNGTIDILRSPQSLKPWPCVLKKLTITLPTSIESFEDRLCELLNQDRLMKDQINPDGGIVTITERKLKVGVHNGWRFVRTPHILFLDKTFAPSTPNRVKRNASIRSNNRSPTVGKDCIALSLRSQLELDEMICHPLFAIIFQLEYVVNVPCIQFEFSDNRKGRTKLSSSFGSIPLARKCSVALRVATWVPFESGNIGNRKISLELSGGLSSNPFGSMLFSDIAPASGETNTDLFGRIEFGFYQSKLKQNFVTGSQSSYGTESLKDKNPVVRSLTPAMNDQVFYGSSPDQPQTEFAALSLKPPLPVTPQKSPRLNKTEESQYMQELPIVRQPFPYVIATPKIELHKPVPMGRAALALIHSVDYPKLVDSEGNPPFIVDVQERVNYDVSKEMKNQLHASEINIQFLAVSCCSHRTLFFTFQFYRFPQTTTERMYLKNLDSVEQGDRNTPCVLQKSARDGSQSKSSPPGLLVKYSVDPSFMQAGEKKTFIDYLHQQKLHIDVWDGDSLLPIGSTYVELKYLLRQNHRAVQVSQEVDVSFMDYSEDHPMLTNDSVQSGQSYPTGVKVYQRAKLYLRMANVGYLPETNVEKINAAPISKSSAIVSPNLGMFTDTDSPLASQKLKTSAKLMSDCDTELATALLTRKSLTGKTKKMKEEEINAKRRRKVERMAAVRQLSGSTEIPSAFILKKEEKLQRTRDLRTIQMYREKVKSDAILSKLEENITSHHILHCSLGKVSFFEFTLKNPYPIDQAVLIRWEDRELSVVVNSKEWRYLKASTNTTSVMEEQMFSSATEDGVKLFVRASELVYIPFKFQSFTSEGVTPEMGPSHPLHVKSGNYSLQTFGKDTTLSSKNIKVTFVGNEEKPLAILQLRIELHPHSIDQTFRFFQAEQTFLKKAIRLPPWHTLPGCTLSEHQVPPKIKAYCSDGSALCEINQVESGEPQEVYLKVPCGLSPSIKRLFVLIFIDEFSSVPCQIWQVYVHSLQRIDMSATEGQTSKLSILLKGSQTSRMVKCFSSNPDELKIIPEDSFMLLPSGVHEIGLSVQPVHDGRRMMFVNVVDLEFYQLVKSWLVMVMCIPPHLSKVFEINLKVGGGPGSNKKITFSNPYPVKKSFFFKTNRDDLLRFKEDGVMLGGGESYIIGLTFIPQMSVGTAMILVFINDKEGKNEETFKVTCHYVI